MKKLVSGAVAGLLAVSSVAAVASPATSQSADRKASPVGEAEELFGGSLLLALLGALAAAGVIVLVADDSNADDLPASP